MAARYRKVDPKIYDSESFRQLSKPAPNGQTLFMFLLTCPEVVLPGVIQIGRLALAERLWWLPEETDDVLKELVDNKIVLVNNNARIVFLRRAYQKDLNQPQSINVIKGWGWGWTILPTCDLKLEIWTTYEAWLKAKGKAWGEAFRKACPKPDPKHTRLEMRDERDRKKDPLLTEGSGEVVHPLEKIEVKAETPKAETVPLALEEPKSPATVSDPVLLQFPCRGNPPIWDFTKQRLETLEKHYPGIDILKEAHKALALCEAGQPKTAKGYPKFLVNWLNRTADRQPVRGSNGSTNKPTFGGFESDGDRARRKAADAQKQRESDAT